MLTNKSEIRLVDSTNITTFKLSMPSRTTCVTDWRRKALRMIGPTKNDNNNAVTAAPTARTEM